MPPNEDKIKEEEVNGQADGQFLEGLAVFLDDPDKENPAAIRENLLRGAEEVGLLTHDAVAAVLEAPRHDEFYESAYRFERGRDEAQGWKEAAIRAFDNLYGVRVAKEEAPEKLDVPNESVLEAMKLVGIGEGVAKAELLKLGAALKAQGASKQSEVVKRLGEEVARLTREIADLEASRVTYPAQVSDLRKSLVQQYKDGIVFPLNDFAISSMRDVLTSGELIRKLKEISTLAGLSDVSKKQFEAFVQKYGEVYKKNDEWGTAEFVNEVMQYLTNLLDNDNLENQLEEKQGQLGRVQNMMQRLIDFDRSEIAKSLIAEREAKKAEIKGEIDELEDEKQKVDKDVAGLTVLIDKNSDQINVSDQMSSVWREQVLAYLQSPAEVSHPKEEAELEAAKAELYESQKTFDTLRELFQSLEEVEANLALDFDDLLEEDPAEIARTLDRIEELNSDSSNPVYVQYFQKIAQSIFDSADNGDEVERMAEDMAAKVEETGLDDALKQRLKDFLTFAKGAYLDLLKEGGQTAQFDRRWEQFKGTSEKLEDLKSRVADCEESLRKLRDGEVRNKDELVNAMNKLYELVGNGVDLGLFTSEDEEGLRSLLDHNDDIDLLLYDENVAKFSDLFAAISERLQGVKKGYDGQAAELSEKGDGLAGQIADLQKAFSDADSEPLEFKVFEEAGLEVKQKGCAVLYRGFKPQDLGTEKARKRAQERLEETSKLLADGKLAGKIIEDGNSLETGFGSLPGDDDLKAYRPEIKEGEKSSDSLAKIVSDLEIYMDGMRDAYDTRAELVKSGMSGEDADKRLDENKKANQANVATKAKLKAMCDLLKKQDERAKAFYSKMGEMMENLSRAQSLGIDPKLLPANFDQLVEKFEGVRAKRDSFAKDDIKALVEVYKGMKDYLANEANFLTLSTEIDKVAEEVEKMGDPEANEAKQVKILAAMLQRQHPDWAPEQVQKAARQRLKLQNIRLGSLETEEEMIERLTSTKFDAMQVSSWAKLHERMSVPSAGAMVPLKSVVGDMRAFVEPERLRSLLKGDKLELAAWAAIYESFRIASGGKLPQQCYMIAEGMRDKILDMPKVKAIKLSGPEKVKRAELAVRRLIGEQQALSRVENFMANYEKNEVAVEKKRQRDLLLARIELFKLRSLNEKNRIARRREYNNLTDDISEEVVNEVKAEGEFPNLVVGSDWVRKQKLKMKARAEGLAVNGLDLTFRETTRAGWWLWRKMAHAATHNPLTNNKLTRAVMLDKVFDLTGKVATWQPEAVQKVIQKSVKDVTKSHIEAAHEREDYSAREEELKGQIEKLEKKTEAMKFEIPKSDISILNEYFDVNSDPAEKLESAA